jgi:hypothetical protein
MDDIMRTTAHQTPILDLPKEILLDIFSYFDSKFPVRDPSAYRKPQATEAKDRLEFLGTNRLVCRSFNELISPLLCPVVSVSLSSGSMDRLEGLSRNPLIAQGIRGISISLLFRPQAIATSFSRYHAYSDSLLRELERECDYHTEFQDYEQDDYSEDAVAWRNYSDAWGKILKIRRGWRDLMDDENMLHDSLQQIYIAQSDPKADGGDQNAAGSQAILTSCFEKYAMAHADEASIISDRSFIRSVVGALSRSDSCNFFWFNEDQLGEETPRKKGIIIATDESALVQALTQSQEWLSIEDTSWQDDDDSGLFFPASILTELPIACHNAKLHLTGLSVSCFPLLKGYRCLLPATKLVDDIVDSDPWAQFAAACAGLEIFEFGRHGMNIAPLRPARHGASDLEIIDGFIGAAISGPHLQNLHITMHPFRVRQGRPEKHSLYPGSSILAAIRTTQLRKVLLHAIDVCEQSLLGLTSSRHLTDFRLTNVTLSRGRYAPAMSLLHDLAVSRKRNNASPPSIHLTSLHGAELKKHSTFDNNNSRLWGSDEERLAFWERLKKQRMHPGLLTRVEQWISDGCASDVNPLSKIKSEQNQVD